MIIITCKICNNKVEVSNNRFKICSLCSKNKQKQMCREYKKRNKDSIKNYNKQYKEKNKESISLYNKNYNIENREQIQKRQTAQHKERRKTDPKYKMSIVLRNRFRKFYKGINKNSFVELIGCSYINYIKWVEFNFDSNMTWENHGDIWHIDHVLLCCLFNHEDKNEREICFNWKNTRPLLTKKNLSRKKIDTKDTLNHEIKLHFFEKNNRDGYKHINFDFAYLTTKLLKKFNNGLS